MRSRDRADRRGTWWRMRRRRDLTKLMELPTLESVFAQLVQQTDTERVARDVVGVMQVRHA